MWRQDLMHPVGQKHNTACWHVSQLPLIAFVENSMIDWIPHFRQTCPLFHHCDANILWCNVNHLKVVSVRP